MTRNMFMICFGATVWVAAAPAGEFPLLVGVDGAPAPGQTGYWPDVARSVSPHPASCCANNLYDGDRLAGTSPRGPQIVLRSSGTPLFWPNEFGSLSFTFRRGSVPAGAYQIPLQGVDFLGGPLLDLDGDLNDGRRSLIPVVGQTAVPIPGTSSLIDLTFNESAGTVSLNRYDATGTNEGGPGISADTAVTLNALAGTNTNGVPGDPINPSIDTRHGTLVPFSGSGGTLAGVYRVENLGYEFWQDTLLASSSTASTLGTFQFLGTFRGWLVKRNPSTGLFPTLVGEGLGTTLWPLVSTSQVGNTFNTANGLEGGTAMILTGFPGDDFTVAGNGGVTMTAFGGDLGAYFDNVVVPMIHPLSGAFVYLESAGFGINNSNDPIYLDTVSYDAVIVAQEAPTITGDCDDDADVDLFDFACFQGCFTGPGPATLNPDCLIFDFDSDDDVDLADYTGFEERFTGVM